MRDIHCHILPGVDDGARDLNESLAMLQAAREVGITSMVCTPHCREPYFNYEAMWNAYDLLVAHADGFPLAMSFEVNHSMLMELGLDWVDDLASRGSRDFLLELSTHATAYHFQEYERTIFAIQSKGYRVIIAHPERYRAIQDDLNIARNLVRMGCKLQASADFIEGGRAKGAKKCAKELFAAGLYSYIASDAHCPEHYQLFKRARERYRVAGAHSKLK